MTLFFSACFLQKAGYPIFQKSRVSKNLWIKPNKAKMDLDDKLWQEKCFIWKIVFFQKDQLGIGPMWFIVVQIGQKLDFRAFCSEI